MSIRVMSKVWEHSRASGGQLIVLLALDDFSDDDGYSYPSISKLAAKSRLSERQVQYSIKQAIKDGELSVSYNVGRSHCNLYKILVDKGANIAPVQKLRGAISDIKKVQSTAPYPSVEPSLPLIVPKEDWPEKIYQAYPKKVAKPRAIAAILKAMKTHKPEFLLERTQLYASTRNGDIEYSPHPATWFNGECFNDEPATWTPRKPQPKKPEAYVPKY